MSRPTKEQCVSNIRARAEVLRSIVDGSLEPDPELVKACRTILEFQRFSRRRIGIQKFGSRNTMIKYADMQLQDEGSKRTGWEYLNSLRLAVKEKCDEIVTPRSAAARHRRDTARIEDLTDRLDQTERLLLSQSKAYLWLVQEIGGLAKSRRFSKDLRESLYALLKSHTETFGHLFDPDAEPKSKSGSVVGIGER